MRLLLDTHVLLWAAAQPEQLSPAARALLEDEDNALVFSAASLWEITIKSDLGRHDFRVDPRLFRRALVDNGYLELPITNQHVLALKGLAGHHKDPFDRMLVAQSIAEGIVLVTTDPLVAQYAGPIKQV
ncbi:MAG TPA: type II toxin-antitoxin system VapC family toxin [Trinickia sp.]|jgi:PIN domain nuclease of toxin-antitoxin system|uniref:type II toxin-antitoxin system VapC family toxin n=1 Tax=Trinickia sp. TaxID=2571163 RepID=UPI002C188C68|nr:type II toxin-antitoxin system VapC family toxin [Trinickia sp.]HVW52819.1 type II toxin-antitoxin system VapC family toxin [Trinickia sp.]